MSQMMNFTTIPNSDSRCLMENWFEERTSKAFDDGKNMKDLNIHGHDKIITLNPERSLAQCSEYKAKYRNTTVEQPVVPPRQRALEAFLTQNATADLTEGGDPTEPEFTKCDYKTDYSGHFGRDDFVSIHPTPKFRHSVYSEFPVSYWSENAKTTAVHGVSQVKTQDSPFRKNSSFSKVALGEAWDDNQVKPGDMEFYPKL